MLSRAPMRPTVSVRPALLWLAILFIQFFLGRSRLAELGWILWFIGSLEVFLVAMPLLSLLSDARRQFRGACGPECMIALLGKILGLALAMNHLDVTQSLLSEHGLHGVTVALRLTRVWLVATILPAVIQVLAMLWIQVNWSNPWRPVHVATIALAGAVTYAVCVINGPIQPLARWSSDLPGIWEMFMCGVLPAIFILSASILYIASYRTTSSRN